MIDIEELLNFKKTIYKQYAEKIEKKQFETSFNAFLFSFSQIHEFLKTNQSILEVGSGSGLLIDYLSKKKYDIEGIDPISKPFKNFNIYNNNNKNIHRTTIENFKSTKKYDLVFTLNVIEHIDNWQNFLIKIDEILKPKGMLIIILPNFYFPIELHYMIPNLYSKKILFYCFKKIIRNHENNNNQEKLWESINFIKFNQIISFLEKMKHRARNDKRINSEILKVYMMVKNNKSSKKTHKNITHFIFLLFAKFIYFSRLSNIFLILPTFLNPFIKIISSKK